MKSRFIELISLSEINIDGETQKRRPFWLNIDEIEAAENFWDDKGSHLYTLVFGKRNKVWKVVDPFPFKSSLPRAEL